MHAGGDAHVPPRASPDGPSAVAAQVSSSFLTTAVPQLFDSIVSSSSTTAVV